MGNDNKFQYNLFNEFVKNLIVKKKDSLTNRNITFTQNHLENVINALKGQMSGKGGSNYEKIINDFQIEEKILLLHAYWLWYYPFNIDFNQYEMFFNDIKLKSNFSFSKNHHLASPGTLGSRTNGKDGEILWLLEKVFTFMFDASINNLQDFKKQYVNKFKNKKDGVGIRNMLLHLCEPENFEPIAYNKHKELIINSYKKTYPEIEKMGCDDAIRKIREKELKPNNINDFYDKEIRKKWDEDYKQPSESGDINRIKKVEKDKMGKENGDLTSSSKSSLNLILYGPPGTGKTYHTVNKALEILLSKQEMTELLNGESDLEKVDRKKLLEKFKELKDRGRIVFTTFHQSMSYEDFIEGIKPITSDKGEVTYEVKPGIFKQICERANLLAQNNFQDAWGNFKNDLKTQREIFIKPPKGRTFKRFKIELCQNNTSVRDINDNSKTLNYNRAYEVYTGGTVYYQSYYEGLLELLKEEYNLKDYKAPVDNSEETSNKQEMEQDSEPYVLIIDEINRGNVANIFGELITLIEKDKRLGGKEQLTVKLPYSNYEFGVPSNLYIIGTMNTADRSVEALDTALRRRFSFEEMMPDYNLDELKTKVGSYELHKILKTINTRIEVLKDHDHLIGHSYFIGITTEEQLKSAFFDKVIPLLQEYFYGDYEKIQMILGYGFVVKDGDVENATFASNNSTIDRPIVAYKIADKNTIDLNNALDKLMLSTD